MSSIRSGDIDFMGFRTNMFTKNLLRGKGRKGAKEERRKRGKVQSKKAGKQVSNTCCTPTSDGKRIFAFFQNGTAVAYDIAGKGIANPTSMKEAIKLAIAMHKLDTVTMTVL
jgi:hypothetical protein